MRSLTYVCGYCGERVASDQGYRATTPVGETTTQYAGQMHFCPHCTEPTYITLEGRQTPGAAFGGSVAHGPWENRDLFARMRASLAPGGLLVVREFVRSLGEDAALFAVNMLVTTARGNTYTAGEYRDWLAQAGYGGVEFEPVPGRSSYLIFAQNPATGPTCA